MGTITVELINSKALQLLKDLEAMNIIRLYDAEPPLKKTRLSDKYRGIISKESGVSLNEHVAKMRNEWGNT